MKESSSLLFPLSQYTISLSNTALSCNQCYFIPYVFESLSFMPELKILLWLKCMFLGVFLVACGPILLKLSAYRYLFFPLLNVPRVPASASEHITLHIVFHFVWIGTFILGVVFTGHGEGQSLI